MPVFNAARATSLALLTVVSVAIAACGSGGSPSVATPTAPTLAAPSERLTQAAIHRDSGSAAAAPVPGEFRRGPGNQQPPGIVIPYTGKSISSGPVPGEFRLGPGNQQPPGIVIPLD